MCYNFVVMPILSQQFYVLFQIFEVRYNEIPEDNREQYLLMYMQIIYVNTFKICTYTCIRTKMVLKR